MCTWTPCAWLLTVSLVLHICPSTNAILIVHKFLCVCSLNYTRCTPHYMDVVLVSLLAAMWEMLENICQFQIHALLHLLLAFLKKAFCCVYWYRCVCVYACKKLLFTMNINLSANLLRGFLFTLTMALYLSNFVDYFSLSCIILCFFSALNILVIGKFLIISEFWFHLNNLKCFWH